MSLVDNPTVPTSRSQTERRLEQRLAKGPGLRVQMDIINKCNLRCVMCHYSDPTVFSRPTKRITLEGFRSMFDPLAPHVEAIMLSCGDEPLVSKEFPGIVRYLAEAHRHIEVQFCTNATLLTHAIRSLIIETGVTVVDLSLDGATRSTFEAIRVGASYDKVVGNILALRDLKAKVGSPLPELVANYTMMRSNVEEMPAFVEMCARLGVRAINFRHVVPSSYFHEEDQLLRNHPARFNHCRDVTLRAARRQNRRFGASRISVMIPPPFPSPGALSDSPPACDLRDFETVAPDPAPDGATLPHPSVVRRRAFQGRLEVSHEGAPCHRPFTNVAIEGQDRVMPCPWYKGELGHLNEDGDLAKIFFGEGFQSLRAVMTQGRFGEGCRECPVIDGYLPETTPSGFLRRAIRRLRRP